MQKKEGFTPPINWSFKEQKKEGFTPPINWSFKEAFLLHIS